MTARDPRTVVYLPLEPRREETTDGLVVASAGPGFDQVVTTLTPAAAHQLAHLLFSHDLLKSEGTRDGSINPDTWYGFAVDLAASAGLCDPRLLPEPVQVPLYPGSTR